MKIGDKVICIKTFTAGWATGAISGEEYTIFGIGECGGACGQVELDVGISSPSGTLNYRCSECGWLSQDHGIWYQPIENFRKVEYASATAELANKEVVEEKSDIPVKEPKPEHTN